MTIVKIDIIIVFQAMNDYVGMCPLLRTTRVDTDTIDKIM